MYVVQLSFDELRHRQYGPRHNGRDGEAENAMSENVVPPWSVLPLRGDPGERPIDPELSVKSLHRPWTRIPVPSIAAIAGRGSSCRQGLATVGRVL